jgi:hypothetical protein
MSRNHFISIWQVWHFSDNSQQTQESGQLCKTWPIYEYFVKKFKSVYSPKQELSLDKAIIPWQGHLKFGKYSPGKITKYGVLVRMVCQAVPGYICVRAQDIFCAQFLSQIFVIVLIVYFILFSCIVYIFGAVYVFS